MNWQAYIDQTALVFNYLILFYAISLAVFYILLGLVSWKAMKDYQKANRFTDYRSLMSASGLPGVSLIAPAYNEGLTIVENVRSLLTLHYPHAEIIIVNDGSKDDSLQKLMQAYQLEMVPFAVLESVSTKPVKAVYKSTNRAYRNLVVVDKVNGGKADALNVGINVATHPYIACIDVDCILESDALLKLVKPFLENQERVIAVGGVIRIANSCIVKDGRLLEVKLPSSFLARVQVLEYFRAFLMGRMAWSKVNGLMLISGAFGMFDKEIAIAAGGYNHNTVGEDMELVVRMRRYMHEQMPGIKHSVGFIPDPLCWTEAPESWKILKRQRNRWTRGTAETLWIHRKLFLNPKYGIVGMLSLPFWVFYEWLAPLIEAGGLLFLLALIMLGRTDFWVFLSFFALVYCFAVMFSVFAIWFEERSYHQYQRPGDMFKLILTGMLEPFFYHPVMVWCAVKGNIDLFTGKKSWGEMTRKGFARQPGTS